MTSKSRNLVIALVAIVVAGGALAFVAIGNLGENLVYYWSPSETLSHGEKAYGPTIRLGGVVKVGSLKWEPSSTTLTFQVADSHKPDAAFVNVVSHEVPPQMFREGIGVVVEGTFSKAQVFESNRLMVNHSNEYKPPKPEDEGKNKHYGEETTVGIK